MIQVNLMHVFVIGPLFLYIGINKNNTKEYFYNILGGIAILLPFIIRTPYIIKMSEKRNIINLLHLLIFMPLLLYISYKKNNLNKIWYYILLILGINVILIHLYEIYEKYK